MSERPIYIPACLLISLITYYLSHHLLFILMVVGGLWIVAQILEWYRRRPVVRTSQTYSDLLHMARGDAALVERLIRYEQKRYPNESRIEWVERALARWQYDHR